MKTFILITLLTYLSTTTKYGSGIITVSALMDEVDECAGWAANGECSLNPKYMLENCKASCEKIAEADREMAVEIEKKIGHIKSFFELEADDIDKKTIKFDEFKGKVTVITNVASYCGYTESHYDGLVKLYNKFKSSPVGFNILAFPCNQFGEQEPEECPKIKRFAQKKGVEFTIMDKVDVNGVDAHSVYHYLKTKAGPPKITWNFATYYVVSPGGTIQSYSGVEPLELEQAILDTMNGDDESEDEESSDDSSDDEDEKEL